MNWKPFSRQTNSTRGQSHAASTQDQTSLLGPIHTTANLSEAEREKVTRCLWQVLILEITTTDDDSESYEDTREVRRKRWPLKSGNLCTAHSIVLYKITWPHKLVYTLGWRDNPWCMITLHRPVCQWIPWPWWRQRSSPSSQSWLVIYKSSWLMPNFKAGSQSVHIILSGYSRWRMARSSGMMWRPNFCFALPWYGIQSALLLIARVWEHCLRVTIVLFKMAVMKIILVVLYSFNNYILCWIMA